MSPAIHGDAFDVAGRIETGAAEHAGKLIADSTLELREKSLQEFRPPGAILIPRRQAGFAGRPQHEKHNGLFGMAWELVLPQADRKI